MFTGYRLPPLAPLAQLAFRLPSTRHCFLKDGLGSILRKRENDLYDRDLHGFRQGIDHPREAPTAKVAGGGAAAQKKKLRLDRCLAQ
jgi:hypothetical protein